MGDIIDLHERVVALESNVVFLNDLLKEKGIIKAKQTKLEQVEE